jgi:hypothetical protein
VDRGQYQYDRQADQQNESRNLLRGIRPVECISEKVDALQQRPRGGDIRDAPLRHLAAVQ